MTDQQIISEIHQLPESAQMEVLHYIFFLKQEHLSPKKSKRSTNRVFGRSKGKYTLSPDFDAPLDDFNEYMQ
ncbi:MAG: DUF2281 domain-containing protein [Ignavibacteria bacterium]|nr:DUF2281 domain-containing protein [Ignavibacteria bacterium]